MSMHIYIVCIWYSSRARKSLFQCIVYSQHLPSNFVEAALKIQCFNAAMRMGEK